MGQDVGEQECGGIVGSLEGRKDLGGPLGLPSLKQLLYLTGSGLRSGVGTCTQGCECKFPLLQGYAHSPARCFPEWVLSACTNLCLRIHREARMGNT